MKKASSWRNTTLNEIMDNSRISQILLLAVSPERSLEWLILRKQENHPKGQRVCLFDLRSPIQELGIKIPFIGVSQL